MRYRCISLKKKSNIETSINLVSEQNEILYAMGIFIVDIMFFLLAVVKMDHGTTWPLVFGFVHMGFIGVEETPMLILACQLSSTACHPCLT